MAEGTVGVKWVDSKLMVGADSKGNTLVIGRRLDHEPLWAGLKSSDLLLLSAAACATYDVVVIMERQRSELPGVEVSVTGVQDDEPPYAFKSMHMHFVVQGPVDDKKVARAIQLSEEKYCSVTNTLRPAIDITWDFEIVT